MNQPTKANPADTSAVGPQPPPHVVEATIFVELAKLAQESFFNRREVEWRSAFGLWTAIGAWTYVSVTNAKQLVQFETGWLPWLFSALVVVLLFGWQLPLRRAFEDDKLWKHYYMHRAAGCTLPEPSPTGFFTGLWHDRHAPWTVSQIVVTAAFLFASYIATKAAIAQAIADQATS